MAWLSILPSSFSELESLIVKLFVLLGILCIVPGILMIVIDLLLYAWRALTYDIPYIGGRARGRPRPRAPTLTERPNGEKRSFGLMSAAEESEGHASATDQDVPSRPLKRQNTATGEG